MTLISSLGHQARGKDWGAARIRRNSSNGDLGRRWYLASGDLAYQGVQVGYSALVSLLGDGNDVQAGN